MVNRQLKKVFRNYTEEKIREECEVMKILKVDGIWYKISEVNIEDSKDDSKIAYIWLESLEGEELEKVLSKERKSKDIKLLNIPAFIHNLNENYKDIIGIIPLQRGEQFRKYLIDELNIYDGDFIYPEKLEDKITYDEETEEWEFKEYKFLVIVREETNFGYSQGYYALKDINNLNLVDTE
ncbi:MAG: hypothetical protein ACRC5S_05345 [Cetobacterium sp.]